MATVVLPTSRSFEFDSRGFSAAFSQGRSLALQKQALAQRERATEARQLLDARRVAIQEQNLGLQEQRLQQQSLMNQANIAATQARADFTRARADEARKATAAYDYVPGQGQPSEQQQPAVQQQPQVQPFQMPPNPFQSAFQYKGPQESEEFKTMYKEADARDKYFKSSGKQIANKYGKGSMQSTVHKGQRGQEKKARSLRQLDIDTKRATAEAQEVKNKTIKRELGIVNYKTNAGVTPQIEAAWKAGVVQAVTVKDEEALKALIDQSNDRLDNADSQASLGDNSGVFVRLARDNFIATVKAIPKSKSRSITTKKMKAWAQVVDSNDSPEKRLLKRQALEAIRAKEDKKGNQTIDFGKDAEGNSVRLNINNILDRTRQTMGGRGLAKEEREQATAKGIVDKEAADIQQGYVNKSNKLPVGENGRYTEKGLDDFFSMVMQDYKKGKGEKDFSKANAIVEAAKKGKTLEQQKQITDAYSLTTKRLGDKQRAAEEKASIPTTVSELRKKFNSIEGKEAKAIYIQENRKAMIKKSKGMELVYYLYQLRI